VRGKCHCKHKYRNILWACKGVRLGKHSLATKHYILLYQFSILPQMLDSITKETKPNPNAAIIWMHGLGADGYDFADIIPELSLPENLAIRFIFPHAPIMPVTINGGYKMRAWYDISNEDLGREPDIEGIEKNSKFVAEFVDAEIEKGISSERILLIGFSQGGVMALHTATRYPIQNSTCQKIWQ